MGYFAEHFVYLYSDVNRTPVYVGCTSDLTRRKSQHKRRSWWWTPELEVSHDVYPSLGTALAAEAVLINDLQPWGNSVVPADPRLVSDRDLIGPTGRLYLLSEAAEFLGISHVAITELIDAGRLACVDIGIDSIMPRVTSESLVAYEAALEAAS